MLEFCLDTPVLQPCELYTRELCTQSGRRVYCNEKKKQPQKCCLRLCCSLAGAGMLCDVLGSWLLASLWVSEFFMGLKILCRSLGCGKRLGTVLSVYLL